MRTRSWPTTWALVAATAAVVFTPVTPVGAAPAQPGWGKGEEGKTLTIGADFRNDWSRVTFTSVHLNPREQTRTGYFRLSGPSGTLTTSEKKAWRAKQKFVWKKKAAIGRDKRLCAEFMIDRKTRYGEPVCIIAS